MNRFSKIVCLAAAAAALAGCSYTGIRDGAVGGCLTMQDSVVSGWNEMVEHFEADAPKYGLEAPSSSGHSAEA